jgi:hypothetical protein
MYSAGSGRSGRSGKAKLQKKRERRSSSTRTSSTPRMQWKISMALMCKGATWWHCTTVPNEFSKLERVAPQPPRRTPPSDWQLKIIMKSILTMASYIVESAIGLPQLLQRHTLKLQSLNTAGFLQACMSHAFALELHLAVFKGLVLVQKLLFCLVLLCLKREFL